MSRSSFASNASAFNLSDCTSLDNVSLPKFPFICDRIKWGDRSWRGILCFPFWEYQPLPVLMCFMALIWILRPFAMKRVQLWTRDHKKKVEERRVEQRRQKEALNDEPQLLLRLRQLGLGDLMEQAAKSNAQSESYKALNAENPKEALIDVIVKAWDASWKKESGYINGRELQRTVTTIKSAKSKVAEYQAYAGFYYAGSGKSEDAQVEIIFCESGEVKQSQLPWNEYTSYLLDEATPSRQPISSGGNVAVKNESSQPLLGDARKGELHRRKSKAEQVFQNSALSEGGTCGPFRCLFRILIQVAQWWLLMTFLLIGLLYCELARLDRLFHFDSEVWAPMINLQQLRTPQDFADAGMPDWIASFSIYSLVALIFIYAIVLVCIIGQVFAHFYYTLRTSAISCLACADGSALVSEPRDVAIQVLLLPTVYGFLSARSVINMWCCITDQYPLPLDCSHWDAAHNKEVPADSAHQSKLLMKVYGSNFAVADMYEAWAMYCFAQMLAKILEPELKDKVKWTVVSTFAELLTLDVLAFVFVELCSALYSVLLTWIEWRMGVDMCEVAPYLCILSPYLAGADWCCSSIAIYNLLVIEHRLHGWKAMQLFGPRLKFFSIKVMVLVSFWCALLSPILKALLDVTEHQIMLLDAAFRIYTMAFVAILNIFAWWPWRDWVTKVLDDQDSLYDAKQKVLKRKESFSDGLGIKSQPTPGILSLVKELLPNVDEYDFKAVETAIDGMSTDELDLFLYKGSQIGWIMESVELKSASESERSVTMGTFLGRPRATASGVALMTLKLGERKKAITRHLQSFYPP